MDTTSGQETTNSNYVRAPDIICSLRMAGTILRYVPVGVLVGRLVFRAEVSSVKCQLQHRRAGRMKRRLTQDWQMVIAGRILT